MTKEKNIVDLTGKTKKNACLSCAREKGEITWGNIAKSNCFDAHQDYEIPIPGFIIISSRRHIQSIDEFTENEQQDFIKFLCRLRSAQRQSLGIESSYLIQKENPLRHFHMWLFPRYDWMEEKFGSKLKSITEIAEYAKKNMNTQENIQEIETATQKLKQFLSNTG